MRKLYWILPMLFSCGVACSEPSDATAGRSWTPSKALISEIEASLDMPAKAFPLDTYVRYFAGEVADNRRLVVGEFLHDPENAGVRIVEREKMPEVLDGGCGVVNLKYDIERKEVLAFFCNGEA